VSEPFGPLQQSGEALGRNEKSLETQRQDRSGAGVAVQTLR